jgi:hypothetical protein
VLPSKRCTLRSTLAYEDGGGIQQGGGTNLCGGHGGMKETAGQRQSGVWKCIEERGNIFLHLLSPQRQNALHFYFICWRLICSITVTHRRQFCICIALLDSALTTTFFLSLMMPGHPCCRRHWSVHRAGIQGSWYLGAMTTSVLRGRVCCHSIRTLPLT